MGFVKPQDKAFPLMDLVDLIRLACGDPPSPEGKAFRFLFKIEQFILDISARRWYTSESSKMNNSEETKWSCPAILTL